MLHSVYISSFSQLSIEQLPQPDYSINYCEQNKQQICTVTSDNCIVLYSACLEHYKQISKQNASLICNNNKLCINLSKEKSTSKQERISQNLQYLLNYLQYSHLEWITQDWQAQLLIKYMQQDINENASFPINMNGTKQAKLFCILKFKQDLQESGIDISSDLSSLISNDNMIIDHLVDHQQRNNVNADNKKAQCAYFAVFDSKNPITYSLIMNFRVKTLFDAYLLDKLQLIDINSIYNSKNIMMTFYKCQKNNLLIYGNQLQCNQLHKNIDSKLKQIKRKQFERGSSIINNINTIMYRCLCQKLKLCKVNDNQANIYIQVFYDNKIEQLFLSNFVKNLDVKQLKYTQLIRNLFKQDPELDNLKSNNSELIRVKNRDSKNSQDYLTGKRSVIQKIQTLAKIQKDNTIAKQSGAKSTTFLQSQASNCMAQTINNIQITRFNYESVFECCNTLRILRAMPFKIDITIFGKQIRIINTVKNYKSIYIIFDTYSDIVKLQSIIEDKVSLWKIKKAINIFNSQFTAQPYKIQIDNKQANLTILPVYAGMGGDGSISEILKKHNADQAHNKIILCSVEILATIFGSFLKDVDKCATFAVDCEEPLFQNIPLLMADKQELKKNQISITTQSNNKTFRNSFEKDKQMVRHIMSTFLIQYCIGDYILTEIDNYNVAFMLSREIQSLYFIVGKNINDTKIQTVSTYQYNSMKKRTWNNRQEQRPNCKQFVYFTYHQKLMKVIRNNYGQFQSLEDSLIWELGALHEKQLKACFRRAFMVGQKYVSVRVPYQHIKSSKFSDIKLINKTVITNRNLINFYLLDINESHIYRAEVFVKPLADQQKKNNQKIIQNNGQNLENMLSKRIVLKFDDPIIKDLIKKSDFGYGNITKKRQGTLYCIQADYHLCLKLLNKFSEHYSKMDEIKQSQENDKKKQAQKGIIHQVNGYISK